MNLVGKTVAVTRASRQSSELVDALRNRGAVVVEAPTIEIVSPVDGGAAIAEAFERIAKYEWLIVTSMNTVDRIAPYLPVQIKVAAIGSTTAKALEGLGTAVALVPPSFVAESLVDVFPTGAGRVLLPQAAIARDVVAEGLRGKGWQVDVVEAYRTVAVEPTSDQRRTVESIDVVTFTSSSTVQNFIDTYGRPRADVVVACIGPVSARTALDNGLRVDVIASEHTIDGLVSALVEGAPGQSK